MLQTPDASSQTSGPHAVRQVPGRREGDVNRRPGSPHGGRGHRKKSTRRAFHELQRAMV